MSRTEAFLLGGFGGLLPILVSALSVDLSPIIDHPDILTIGNYVGYAIRVVVLIVLGGAMALLNSEVRQPLAIVQLGIAAPALVTSVINAAPAKPLPVQHAYMSFISVANAQESRSPAGRIQFAGGFLADVAAGLGTRLDILGAQNRATPGIAPPTGVGNFCVTAIGRVPTTPNPIGSPCGHSPRCRTKPTRSQRPFLRPSLQPSRFRPASGSAE
jgi:hypothetical protein